MLRFSWAVALTPEATGSRPPDPGALLPLAQDRRAGVIHVGTPQGVARAKPTTDALDGSPRACYPPGMTGLEDQTALLQVIRRATANGAANSVKLSDIEPLFGSRAAFLAACREYGLQVEMNGSSYLRIVKS